MSKIKIDDDECLKIFQKFEEEGWVSESELRTQSYESERDNENTEKMKRVRACKKAPMSGMRKPKGIEEWCD